MQDIAELADGESQAPVGFVQRPQILGATLGDDGHQRRQHHDGSDANVRDELLFDVSRYLLEHFDLMSQIVAKAYLDEEFERLRLRDSLRYELSSIVFQFPHDTEGFQRAAESLGLDPTAPRIALALDEPDDRPD